MPKKILTIPVIAAAILTILLTAIVINACTDQQMARSYGGEADMSLPCGQKLIMVTWKDKGDLWYLTRPMQTSDTAVTYTFNESSSYGIMEGTVKIKECLR